MGAITHGEKNRIVVIGLGTPRVTVVEAVGVQLSACSP